MLWLYSTTIGIAAGLGVGYVLERVPVVAVAQTVCAAVVGMLVGSALIGLIWFMRPRGLGGIFIGIGVENLAFVAGLCIVAAVVHVALGRMGAPAALVAHRAMALGCIGGLLGAWSVAWAMAASERFL
jgi:hypothetical protein